MVQRRSSTRFAPETLQRLRVLRDIVGEKLEGDKAAKVSVLGLVDDTHAAAAEFLDDAVVRDGLADHSDEAVTSSYGSLQVTSKAFTTTHRGSKGKLKDVRFLENH